MITITATSMDELNSVFKKLKGYYKATKPVSLDPENLQYSIVIEKALPARMSINLIENAVDTFDGWEELKSLDETTLADFLEGNTNQPHILKLKDWFSASDKAERKKILMFLGSAIGIEVELNDLAKQH